MLQSNNLCVLCCAVLCCAVLCRAQVFGENMAILSGDALLVYAFEHIARDTKGVSADRIVKVVIELARASGADGLVGGQVVDIQSEDKEVGRARCDDGVMIMGL